MIALELPRTDKLDVLCLGAHCDDIEIGCGGTILHLLQRSPKPSVRWVVFCSNRERRAECEKSAERFLGKGSKPRIFEFRDGFLPYNGGAVKEQFEELKRELKPDLILTHFRNDRHQDHRLVCELTWNTWRDHMIWEYEIPKYDGDLGAPNLFVPLGEDEVETKLRHVIECYGSQHSRQWFDRETLLGLMRLRGVEANAPGRYAEAFYTPKLVVDPSRAGKG